jgi:hypothetical protein
VRPDNYSEDDVQDLIGEIDERLVMTAHPYREDSVVTVWLGGRPACIRRLREDLEEEDLEGNGHRE